MEYFMVKMISPLKEKRRVINMGRYSVFKKQLRFQINQKSLQK